MQVYVKNETEYDTRVLKRILKRAAEEVGCRQDRRVRVSYSNKGTHWGYAWYGTRRREHPNSVLTVPRDAIDPVQFARVARHEFMHNLGVRHGEMTEEQRYCTAGAEWAEGIAIPKREKKEKPAPPKKSATEKREEKARAMLKRTDERIEKLERLLAAAKKNRSKWAKKVKYYDAKSAA